MLWNAKNGEVSLGNTKMNYVSFGHGNRKLIILPGLSDGLATVKGKALMLAVTAPRVNDRIRDCVSKWIGLAEQGDHHP